MEIQFAPFRKRANMIGPTGYHGHRYVVPSNSFKPNTTKEEEKIRAQDRDELWMQTFQGQNLHPVLFTYDKHHRLVLCIKVQVRIPSTGTVNEGIWVFFQRYSHDQEIFVASIQDLKVAPHVFPTAPMTHSRLQTLQSFLKKGYMNGDMTIRLEDATFQKVDAQFRVVA